MRILATNADIAAQTDFSSTSAVTWGSTTITPNAGGIVLDKVRSDYLWDFSQEPPFDQTLYAVWSDTVTVTFNIAYTANLNAATVKLHNWNGPAVVSTETPYAFCDTDVKGRYITYTMAKGEFVPKPSDPSPHSDRPTWNFVSWLISSASTDGCRSSTKNPNDPVFKTPENFFDFAQRVTSDVMLVTSWMANEPQFFTFTIENHVEDGSDEDEFDYTIAVSDELVYGKLGTNGSNRVGEPDRKWGSVTTSLKNNQQYTVGVKVSYYKETNSVEITVTDRDGFVVKSGHVIYCNKNGVSPYYVSDYKYTLTVTQDEKVGYETTVATQDLSGSIVSSTDDSTRSFTFASCMSRTASCQSYFTPEENVYSAGSNSLSVIFTNKGSAVIVPTGISFNSKPYVLMACFGLIMFLLAISGSMRKHRKRALADCLDHEVPALRRGEPEPPAESGKADKPRKPTFVDGFRDGGRKITKVVKNKPRARGRPKTRGDPRAGLGRLT